MASFGISIFQSPQNLIALKNTLFQSPAPSIAYLEALLHRTKNPPLSVIYTCKFLDHRRSIEENSLDIIRFLSHLSDMSQNTPSSVTSMQSSLENVISENSFLIEIRHNLTHKNMIERNVVEIAKGIILKDISQKYWDPLEDKILGTYNLQINQVFEAYQKIYGRQMAEQKKEQIQRKINGRKKQCLDEEWLQQKSSNYQFKQFFPQFLIAFSKEKSIGLIRKLPSHKWAIAMNLLLHQFIYNRRDQKLLDIIIEGLKEKDDAIMKESLILKKLRQISFNSYIGLSKKLLETLPEKVQSYLQQFWRNKGKKNNIYRRYGVKQEGYHAKK